jgi:hypothetical protein
VEPGLAAVIERAMAREPQWRFGSANSMRAALAGRTDPAVVGRPPTWVLASPLPDPSTVMVPPPTTTPVQVHEGPPGQRKGSRGENGKGRKIGRQGRLTPWCPH